jgi:hypothetical protein
VRPALDESLRLQGIQAAPERACGSGVWSGHRRRPAPPTTPPGAPHPLCFNNRPPAGRAFGEG